MNQVSAIRTFQRFLHIEPRIEAVAMQVLPDVAGSLRLGLATKIELTDDVKICGLGFNENTLRVLKGEAQFYVFREDLERAGFASHVEY